jgi:hypothetical protein
VKKRTPTTIQGPSLREMFEAVKRDPNFWLSGAVRELADTGNPYWAWNAIQVCIQHQKEFPDWLLVYLGECAERMMSDQAKESGDLGRVLPWIFGFPSVLDPTQRKRGPGNLLDPLGPDRSWFALRFAIRLENGERLSAAMQNAANDVFDGINANADEKTLRRWLLKEFDLKDRPSNVGEWKAAAREHFRLFPPKEEASCESQ